MLVPVVSLQAISGCMLWSYAHTRYCSVCLTGHLYRGEKGLLCPKRCMYSQKPNSSFIMLRAERLLMLITGGHLWGVSCRHLLQLVLHNSRNIFCRIID